MVDVTFQEEDFSEIVSEVDDCTRRHYHEITQESDEIPYDPNWEAYVALSKQGILSIVTARHGGNLVGYVVSYVMPHMHHKSTVFAIQDAYFLKKEYRKGFTGYKLLKANEKVVAGKGAKAAVLGVKADHEITPIMSRLGYRLAEHGYFKIIGD